MTSLHDVRFVSVEMIHSRSAIVHRRPPRCVDKHLRWSGAEFWCPLGPGD